MFSLQIRDSGPSTALPHLTLISRTGDFPSFASRVVALNGKFKIRQMGYGAFAPPSGPPVRSPGLRRFRKAVLDHQRSCEGIA